MIIEKTQKRWLLDEAARKGITIRRIQDIPEFYRDLLGQTDIGQQRLGSPLTSMYRAVDGEEIDVQKMAKFFQGLVRDVHVLSAATSEIENNLTLLNLQFWARTQLTKNLANAIQLSAESEKLRAQLGARWVFSESFNTTQFVDMQRTSAWIDTAQGTVFLPNQGESQTVRPQSIMVTEQSLPEGGSFLGSGALHAFDGLESTNWRASFSRAKTYAKCSITFPVANINAMTIDPVGYGILLTVEWQTDKGAWSLLFTDTFYSKRTLVFDTQKVKNLRFKYSPLDSSYPRTAGIRACTIYSSQPVPKASLYTTLLKSQYSFSELKIQTKVTIPGGSHISTYWATASGGPWTPIQVGDWHAVTSSNTTQVNLGAGTLQQQGALWIQHVSNPSINNVGGSLAVGLNQIEVCAFRRDWAAESESPRLLRPQDFVANTTISTWVNPVRYTKYYTAYPRVLQGYGLSTLSASPAYIMRGKGTVVLRKTPDYPYTEFSVVPYTGNTERNCLQPDYNYRFRCVVHCARDTFYDQGRYWFLQGHRAPGTRSFKDVGRAFGACTLYINNQLVISDNQPRTVYSDNTLETGAEQGTSFSIKLNRGWNTIDLHINALNTNTLPTDNFDQGAPYLQFTMTPTVFDTEWQQVMAINQVLGSGERKAVSEFDLLWNLPQSPTFWAWTPDRAGVLFNTNSVRTVDGFMEGVYPTSQLSYMGVNVSQEISNLYLRMDMERDERSLTGPILDDYTLLVR